eukprot:3311552-Amphidinium_carterae.1
MQHRPGDSSFFKEQALRVFQKDLASKAACNFTQRVCGGGLWVIFARILRALIRRSCAVCSVPEIVKRLPRVRIESFSFFGCSCAARFATTICGEELLCPGDIFDAPAALVRPTVRLGQRHISRRTLDSHQSLANCIMP